MFSSVWSASHFEFDTPDLIYVGSTLVHFLLKNPGLYLFSFSLSFHVGKDVLVCRGEEEGVLVEGDDGAHVQVLRSVVEGVLV